MKETFIQTEFRNSSLQVSAYLITRGYPLIKTEKQDQRTIFVFQHDPTIEQSVNEFFTGYEVAATTYWSAIKTLKSLLYQ